MGYDQNERRASMAADLRRTHARPPGPWFRVRCGSGATLYAHFKSKGDLIFALWDGADADCADRYR